MTTRIGVITASPIIAPARPAENPINGIDRRSFAYYACAHAIRRMTETAFTLLSPRFERLYPSIGRPSIPPEQSLRALLLQSLYSVRSERMLIEQLEYNLLCRWFVGLAMDDTVWAATTFTKNRERLSSGDIATAFFGVVCG
jgi:transposase